MYDSRSFGQYLKSLRLNKRLTLTRLAELTGFSASYLSRIERGERNIPNARLLKAMAPHLGIPAEELLTAAGYLNGTDRETQKKSEPPPYWDDIIRDPAIDAVLREIGLLTKSEKEGLLLYLQAIKLQRKKKKNTDS